MNQAAVVYLLSAPGQSDPYSQGYLGVTTDYKARMQCHLDHYRLGKQSGNLNVKQAIKQFGFENLRKEILICGSLDYCYAFEEHLRPHENIGWNICKGGRSNKYWSGKKMPAGFTEKIKFANTGKKRTAEQCKKISDAKSKKILINGVVYPSWKIASKATGIPWGSFQYLLKGIPNKTKWNWLTQIERVDS